MFRHRNDGTAWLKCVTRIQPMPELVLAIIARDEARCIARCLQSAQPFVDRMVVLDTGSVDDTPAIARACGAEVHHAAWPDDFAVARNLALRLADADWCLMLDADEWIEQGGESLRAFTLGPPALGAVCVRSEYGQGGQAAQDVSYLLRLLPRGVYYEGRIHEQAVSTLARVRLPLVLGHDGYRPEQLKQKQGRNRPLLLQALLAQPQDPYLLYQLGKDYEIYRDFAEAARHYLQALQQVPAQAAYRHSLTVRCLYCMGRAGRLQEAIAMAQARMGEWQESPDFFFTLGNLWLDWSAAHPELARQQGLPMAELAWQRCLEIGERPELDGSVHGRGSFLAEHNLAVIRGHGLPRC